MPRDVDEWVEARYAVFGREVNRLLYQRAVQGYPQRPQERRGEAILKVAVEELVQLIKGLKEDGLPLNKVA